MSVIQFGTIYVWKGSSGGDWFDNVNNWTPGYPIAGPPGYGDLAIFNTGGAEAVAGAGTASEADIVLGTTLTILDSLSLDGAVSGVGLMIDSGGKVIVANGATKPGVPSAPGDVSVDVIGFTGAGALDVAAGGGLDDTGMVLGDRSTGSGTLTVEGIAIVAPAAAPNGLLIVGNAGSGVVTVQNGGALSAVVGTTLGLQTGSSGTVTLTGAGSTWLAGALTVGQAGTGSVTVRNGGVLTTTSASVIGFDDAGTGTHGTGSVTIEAGGILTALTALGIGSNGTFVVNDGSATANAITLSGGSVTVLNAGTVATKTLTMASGKIDVANGGIFVDSPTAIGGTPGTLLIGGGANFNALGTIIGAVQLNGAVLATGSALGLLRINGDIIGGGTLEPLMTLDLNGVVGPNVSIEFGTSVALQPGIMILDDARDEFGTISGFNLGNTIEIPSGHFTNALFTTGSLSNPGTLTLTGGGEIPLTLSVAGNYAPTDFIATSDTVSTKVTLGGLCFLRGVRISTPAGDVAVEQLSIGDEVLTLLGGTQRIVWIGKGRVLATRGARGAATPVIVRGGALADNVPYRDMHVTKGHGIYVDGVLIPVEFLVNHRSIVWDDHAQEVELYHIELATHDILFADGAPAESYRDDGNRWLFQNANSGWNEPSKEACAPVLTGGPIVDLVWRRLLDRAPARLTRPLTNDPDLHLDVDGQRVNPRHRHGDRYVFIVERSAKEVCIVSRADSPSELGLVRDPRVLGVAIRQIQLWKGARVLVTDADDGRLINGFHAFEVDNGIRWTNGHTTVPLSLFGDLTGPLELVLLLGGTTAYADETIVRGAA